MSDAPKKVPKRPLKARPQKDVDHDKLREDILERFSKTFEYLAR
ncbi:MAG TPA: hypothetical protein VEW25_03195 [Allosphingosinicella sp.]|nr:hypothetical protein [Allosphingosinicella sp.]